MTESRARILAFVGRQILPHEPELRRWLARTGVPREDADDAIQTAYCRMAALDQIGHIRNPRAYFYRTVRSVLLDELRRARVVRLDLVNEIDALALAADEPNPERIAGARRQLERFRACMERLPERCRRTIELRKIEGLSQREVAKRMGLAESTVENDVSRGLRSILRQMAEGEAEAELALSWTRDDDKTRDSNSD